MESVNLSECNHGDAATLARAVQVRRGNRVVETRRSYRRCERCRDPDTGDAYEFVDAELMARNDEAASEAWRVKFGEALPSAGPRGRPTRQPRVERVTVLLTSSELAEIDRDRGPRTRSDFIRERVLRKRVG